jgi:site-specific DNA-cytosine methylase
MHRSAMTVVGSFRPEVMAAPGYRKAGDPPRQATPGSVVVTEEERKRLMGLPADWIVVGNQAARDLQIGNGVVVGLMRVLVGINTTH